MQKEDQPIPITQNDLNSDIGALADYMLKRFAYFEDKIKEISESILTIQNNVFCQNQANDNRLSNIEFNLKELEKNFHHHKYQIGNPHQ